MAEFSVSGRRKGFAAHRADCDRGTTFPAMSRGFVGRFPRPREAAQKSRDPLPVPVPSRPRVRDPQVSSCSSYANMQQPAFRSHLSRSFSHDEGHHRVIYAIEGHDIPFEPLRCMQGCQGNAVADRRLLSGRPTGEHGCQLFQRPRPVVYNRDRQVVQSLQRFPPLPDITFSVGRNSRPTLSCEYPIAPGSSAASRAKASRLRRTSPLS